MLNFKSYTQKLNNELMYCSNTRNRDIASFDRCIHGFQRIKIDRLSRERESKGVVEPEEVKLGVVGLIPCHIRYW